MTRTDSRKPVKRVLFYLCFLIVALAVPVIPASSAAETGNAPQAPSKLELQVRDWVAALSARPPFAAWKDAAPEIQALGPGTHGWLVTLTSGGEPVGYLIVQAAADGTYRLGEYGTGPDVLFSTKTLGRSLMENGLITSIYDSYTVRKLYFHPFAAVWEAVLGPDTYWLDAKTGEILPFARKSWDTLFPSLKAGDGIEIPGTGATAQGGMLTETFDPYGKLPWLTGDKPLAADDDAKVQSRIRSRLHLRYVTEPYGDAALYALPVTGFQSWSGGRLDVGLDMEGTRFIPLELLNKYGRFYE